MDWRLKSSHERWLEGNLSPAVRLARQAASHDRDGTSEAGVEAELWLALMLIRLRHHDEFDRTMAGVEPAVARIGKPDQEIKLKLVQALSQGIRGGFSNVTEQARYIVDAPGEAVEGCRSFAWVILALEALRRGDLRTAGDYARRMSAESVLGNSRFPRGLTAWTLVQIEEATHGPEAVAYMVERLISTGGWIYQDLLSTEPGSAAWLVRFMMPRDDTTAQAIATAARGVCERGGDPPVLDAAACHAEGLVRHSAADLLFAATHYGDPWAAASAREDLGVMLAGHGAPAQAIAALEHALTGYLAVQSSRDAARLKRRLHRLGRTYHHARWSEESDVGIRDLTKTEIAVAELVAQGLSNTQAAGQLFISRHTVAYHLRSIFRKLQLTSRVELARTWTELHREAKQQSV
ncbi:response regulator transcription factor [Streptomyces bluensis]|uniref:Response regulator transcription factor n=1 Tax=Streptomyces bluensis TaxID=33897 RepID=A0ABW6UJE7_9ACTN